MEQKIFSLKFERSSTGLWHVYSEGTQRQIMMSHRDLTAIIDDLRAILTRGLEPELKS